MARIKIELTGQFSFKTAIPTRITDLNYGGHVGNDTILSIIHEARVQFLHHHGYKELDMMGVALIMSDVAIKFRSEVFYGDTINVWVGASEFSRVGFDIFYKLERQTGNKNVVVAVSKTAMVCYNYELKKIVQMPAGAKEKLIGL
jgi:acyl-CoA thioester hydrolase